LSTQLSNTKHTSEDDPGRTRALLAKLTAGRKSGPVQNGDHPLVAASSSISADFTITGNITCKGQAQFDGEVNGNIECNQLIVGKNGRIIGDIKAEDVVVFGRVEGAIHCSKITLKSGANVLGDVFHKGIAIEMGALFLGRSDHLPGEPEGSVTATANGSLPASASVPSVSTARK
jgi:cytoskeletal protein CcmA (bactofilin family)